LPRQPGGRPTARGEPPAAARLAVANGRDDEPDSSALERLANARGTVGGVVDADAGDPADVLATLETQAAISAALAGMPEPEREVILLSYRDDLTQTEIAARLGWRWGP